VQALFLAALSLVPLFLWSMDGMAGLIDPDRKAVASWCRPGRPVSRISVTLARVESNSGSWQTFNRVAGIEKRVYRTHKKRPRVRVEECIYPFGMRERP
jgi:hypothetical protein